MTGPAPKLTRSSLVFLRSIPGFSEAWLEQLISDEPGMLRLGDVTVVERQRRQDNAGRLDLLLQDADGEKRYEVELMLGSLDESHIIRAIEYWDIERRRYPGYEHICVIIAEDITARFLNVLGLFSGSLPIIAIQVSALQVEDRTTFTFLKVLESTNLRRDDESEATAKTFSREDWIGYASAENIQLVDQCLAIINAVAKKPRALKYNYNFIGLFDGGRPNNFVKFDPAKSFLWVRVRVSVDEWKPSLETSNMEFQASDDKLWIKLTKKTFEANKQLVSQILEAAVKRDEAV